MSRSRADLVGLGVLGVRYDPVRRAVSLAAPPLRHRPGRFEGVERCGQT